MFEMNYEENSHEERVDINLTAKSCEIDSYK